MAAHPAPGTDVEASGITQQAPLHQAGPVGLTLWPKTGCTQSAGGLLHPHPSHDGVERRDLAQSLEGVGDCFAFGPVEVGGVDEVAEAADGLLESDPAEEGRIGG